MKKVLYILFLFGVFFCLLAGCGSAEAPVASVPDTADPNAAAEAPTTPDPAAVTVTNIYDKTETELIDCSQALEPFFEDGQYVYSFSCIKSQHVIVEYSDGSSETVKDALNAGKISIADLDQYGIQYYTEEKETHTIEVSGISE